MALKTQGKVAGDLIKMESDARYCREVVTIGNSQTVVIGTPLEQGGGTGGADVVVDGAEAAVDAIALEAVTTGGAETANIVCIVRGPCVLHEETIVAALETGVTITELRPYLEARGIVVRAEPDEVSTGTPSS